MRITKEMSPVLVEIPTGHIHRGIWIDLNRDVNLTSQQKLMSTFDKRIEKLNAMILTSLLEARLKFLLDTLDRTSIAGPILEDTEISTQDQSCSKRFLDLEHMINLS